jgi:Protein of unknwon function (DUF3310)
MFKYDEERILNDVENYIKSTYNQHYVRGNDIQVNDLIMAIGHGEGSYISNAIEYLARYGKKDGKNVKDLYKAIHNIILLIHLNHVKTENLLDSDIFIEDPCYLAGLVSKQMSLYGIEYKPETESDKQ